MGILAGLIDKVASFVSSLGDKIPKLDIPDLPLSTYVGTLNDCLYVANQIFPIDELLVVLGLLIAFSFIMWAFYWIQRAINLIRGAG